MTSPSLVRSKPVYLPLSIVPQARVTIFVTDMAEPTPSCFAHGTSVESFSECWVVTGGSTTLPQPKDRTTLFRSPSQMLETLSGRLRHEYMGLRLYAAGHEDFIWQVARIAEQAGLSRQEYSVFRVGPSSRTVMCAHCHTLTHDVTHSPAVCSGCGAALEIRDHFSRLHGAYLGVQADAETPNILPATEELRA